jgi:glucokinase
MASFLALDPGCGMDRQDIGGIGIGVPGVLDLEKGETLLLPNLPGTWPHIPLRNTIQNLTGIQTGLLNDVRAITHGEWRFGAGRGVVACCFRDRHRDWGGLVNGRLHRASAAQQGSWGTIKLQRPRCGCGNHGYRKPMLRSASQPWG